MKAALNACGWLAVALTMLAVGAGLAILISVPEATHSTWMG